MKQYKFKVPFLVWRTGHVMAKSKREAMRNIANELWDDIYTDEFKFAISEHETRHLGVNLKWDIKEIKDV